MQHRLTDCLCSECQTLDALPVRRQGIPGAKQQTFVEPAPLEPWQRRQIEKAKAKSAAPLFDIVNNEAGER